jgi:hypothetical protein
VKSGVHIVSILQRGGRGGGVFQRGASIGGMPNVPQKFADGPINMAPLKKMKKL